MTPVNNLLPSLDKGTSPPGRFPADLSSFRTYLLGYLPAMVLQKRRERQFSRSWPRFPHGVGFPPGASAGGQFPNRAPFF
jgi:hypothetical protein